MTRLGDIGQIHVTATAARQYAEARGWVDEGRVEVERGRVELLKLLLDAHQVTDTSGREGESWRARWRAEGVDVSARVIREGPVAHVVSVSVRDYRPGRGGRRNRCVECRSTDLRRERVDGHPYREGGLESVVLHGITRTTCQECGATSLGIPAIEPLHRLIAEELEGKSPLTPEEADWLQRYYSDGRRRPSRPGAPPLRLKLDYTDGAWRRGSASSPPRPG